MSRQRATISLALTFALLASCSPEALHGTVLAPPQAALRFVLRDQDGHPYELAAPARTITALYFGFTHCKDVCSQTLAKLARARTQARLTQRQLTIVMVTVDPARDTPRVLRAFFARIGVPAVGLTGGSAQLARVYHAYGVEVRSQNGDLVHTDAVYVLDRQGRLRELLDADTPVRALADDLRTLAD